MSAISPKRWAACPAQLAHPTQLPHPLPERNARAMRIASVGLLAPIEPPRSDDARLLVAWLCLERELLEASLIFAGATLALPRLRLLVAGSQRDTLIATLGLARYRQLMHLDAAYTLPSRLTAGDMPCATLLRWGTALMTAYMHRQVPFLGARLLQRLPADHGLQRLRKLSRTIPPVHGDALARTTVRAYLDASRP